MTARKSNDERKPKAKAKEAHESDRVQKKTNISDGENVGQISQNNSNACGQNVDYDDMLVAYNVAADFKELIEEINDDDGPEIYDVE